MTGAEYAKARRVRLALEGKCVACGRVKVKDFTKCAKCRRAHKISRQMVRTPFIAEVRIEELGI